MKTGSVIHYGANDYSIYRDAWALGDKRSAGDGREMFQACGLNGLEYFALGRGGGIREDTLAGSKTRLRA